MSALSTWWAVGLTLVAIAAYETTLLRLLRRPPPWLALARHSSLREEWFRAVSEQKGTELLAVQTLRNALMSATMLASTAALGLMGTVTVAAPSLHASLGAAERGAAEPPRLVLELVLLALLFASLAATLMAVRFYNHAGFIAGMPVGSVSREQWTPAGIRYMRRAGILYGLGLRQLILVVPVLAAILLPAAGPVTAAGVAAFFHLFDRTSGPPEAP